MKPFSEKYRPKSSKEIIGQDKALSILKEFVLDYKNFVKKYKKRALLLYGPPGVGKTASVIAIANEYNLELVMTNASQQRDLSRVRQIALSSLQASLFGKGKVIVFDEVDGISGKHDRGAIGEILKVINASYHPVILIANDAYSDKLKYLRSYCMLIEFKKLTVYQIVKILINICRKEGIYAEMEVLKEIAKRANGDARAAINDLQLLSAGKKKISKEDLAILGYRDVDLQVFEFLAYFFKSTSFFQALRSLNNADLDIDEIFLWVSENITKEYSKAKEIASAFDWISKADVVYGRANRWNQYNLYAYIMPLIAGVSLIKEEKYKKFTKYSFPSKIRLMIKLREARAIAKGLSIKIAKYCHVSTEEAKKYFKILSLAVKNNLKFKDIELEKEEIEFLKNLP